LKKVLPLHSHWTFRESRSRRWLDAIVPGCVHADLRRHKLIPDPFWGANENQVQWIEEKDWVYRCEFSVSAALLKEEFIDLVADGLDTVATVRVNGKLVARTENMFTGYRFPVKALLQKGANVLEIHFGSPMKYIRPRRYPDDGFAWNDPVGGSFHLRKEQCSFGWDWAPRLATSGIYRPIRLEGWSVNRFEILRVTQEHRGGAVILHFAPRLARKIACELRGTISLGGKVVARIEQNKARISAPQLWWPNGLGAQPLYAIEAELVRDGRVLDTCRRRLGLRTIILDRRKDKWGESFRFVVNGRPVFAKGANWIPAHSLVSSVTRATYDDLLTSAVQAHMNMVRVWGGGIYESEEFYDLCDEKGLLVWQDFMFACAFYPGTRPFLDLVAEEAAYQVDRLANRTCLALWCGNNEIEQCPEEILKTPKRKKAYDDVFYRTLPKAVAEHDGVTAYWPCSPHNPEGYEKGHNNENAGDSHFWDVWHARHPVKRYEEKKFRFCSEFGMQSYSSPEVAATFCDPKDFNAFAPAMENHQKNAAGNSIILDYVVRRYRLPQGYAALAYLSQLNQAYCLKTGIEHFRRSMPRTMGALYWQLNDCWPVFSWSSLEFGGKWKALHYAAKRFFAPILVSAHVPGDETVGIGNRLSSTIHEVRLHTVSDAVEDTRGVLEWTLFRLDGRKLEQGRLKVTVRAGQSQLQKSLDFARAMKTHGAREIYLRIRLKTESRQVSEDTVFLTAPRNMELPRTPIGTAIKRISDTEFEIRFRSAGFHHQVQFELEKIPHRADDNYFDLYPNEIRKVRVHTRRPATLAALKHRLKTFSLVDAS